MRQFLLSAVLLLGMAGPLWTDSIPTVVSPTTNAHWTRVVFNDSGAALTSGTVVIWDVDDTEFEQNGYPYVTTTTTADHDWPAGVVKDASCPAAGFCQIVVYGPVVTRIANTTDAPAEDEAVATSTVDGQAGAAGGAAQACHLGILMDDRNNITGADPGEPADNVNMWVFVRPECED